MKISVVLRLLEEIGLNSAGLKSGKCVPLARHWTVSCSSVLAARASMIYGRPLSTGFVFNVEYQVAEGMQEPIHLLII